MPFENGLQSTRRRRRIADLPNTMATHFRGSGLGGHRSCFHVLSTSLFSRLLSMDEIHGDSLQRSWGAVLRKEPDCEGTVLQVERLHVADPVEPRVDDCNVKNFQLQDSHFDKKAKAAAEMWLPGDKKERVRKTLAGMFRASYHYAESGIRSVLYHVVGHVMLDLLREESIKRTLDTHIAKVLDNVAAAHKLWKMLLVLHLFLTPVAESARRMTDSAITYMGTVVAKASK